MAWFFTRLRNFFRCGKKPSNEEETVSTAKIVGLNLAAAGKVGATAGGAVFIGFHTANYIYNTKEGHKTELGMAIALFNLNVSLVVNTVNRFYNARRLPTKIPPISPMSQKALRAILDGTLGFSTEDVRRVFRLAIIPNTPENILTILDCSLPQLPADINTIIREYLYEEKPLGAEVYEEKPLGVEIEDTFWHPGRNAETLTEPTSKQKNGYRIQSIITALNSIYSTISGIQAKDSLLFLTQIIFQYLAIELMKNYNEQCNKEGSADKPLSPLYVFFATNFFAAWLCTSNRISFTKSNQKWARKNYRDYFIDGKWREIDYSTWGITLVGAAINAIVAFYSGIYLNNTIEKDILCHAGVNIPDKLSKGIAGLGAFLGFMLYGIFLAIPANHERKSATGSRAIIDKNLAILPSHWKKLHYGLVLPCDVGNGLIYAQAAFVSSATLGEYINDRDDLNYHWGMQVFGGIAALFTFITTISLDLYGNAREYETRVKELDAKRTIDLIKQINKFIEEEQLCLEGKKESHIEVKVETRTDGVVTRTGDAKTELDPVNSRIVSLDSPRGDDLPYSGDFAKIRKKLQEKFRPSQRDQDQSAQFHEPLLAGSSKSSVLNKAPSTSLSSSPKINHSPTLYGTSVTIQIDHVDASRVSSPGQLSPLV